MKPTIIEENIIEYESFEEGSSVLLAEETPWRGFADELQDLHYLKGAEFIKQFKLIVNSGEFRPVDGETHIYSAISEDSSDYENLLKAARKVVDHGYHVYILPNPKGIRTADYIFERKGVYKLFDLKSITGKASVSNRLMESIGQTNHVILNMLTDYAPRLLAKDIRSYFEANTDAREVIIMKGNKILSISRSFVEGNCYYKMFMKRFLR